MPIGKVVDLSSDGWGVAKEESGRVTFVPGTWIGDEIEFEIISEGKFRLGKLLSHIKKSEAHRDSPCAHWGLSDGQCRACEWMNIHYAEQLKAKELKLSQTLQKFSINPQTRHPILHGEEFGYRNRVKLSHKNGKTGFLSPMSHHIAEIKECLVAEDWINKEIKKLPSTQTAKELWIQKGAAGSFAQGNSFMNNIMKESLEKMLSSKKNTLELFCGEGNFTEILAPKSLELCAYEYSEAAIEKLKSKFPEVRAKALDLYSLRSLAEIYQNKKTERIFLDPPRSGFKELSFLVLKLNNLNEIIYLSCNPTTFARDTAELEGWTLKELYAFDLFPQTPHLEVMGLWVRNA